MLSTACVPSPVAASGVGWGATTGPLACDYLVTSAGVEELAFIDRVLVETQDWTIILADPAAQPGGRWNSAPPFARLDQPSEFFGVGSRPLDTPHVLRRDEILQYCHGVVQRFAQLGRVRFFPMTTFDGRALCSIVDSDDVRPIRVRRKVVRSLFGPSPSTPLRTFPFHVAAGSLVVPPKEVQLHAAGHAKYIVIGGGRTGIEVVLWLFKRGVREDQLLWVMREDMWLIKQGTMTPDSYVETAKAFWSLFAEAETVEAFELGLERAGLRFRIDTSKRPTAFRAVAVAEQDIAQLRRAAPSIIRKGALREVHPERLVLQHGSVPTGSGALYIDCTADDPEERDIELPPVFEARQVNLQLVREIADNGPPSSCFSAALIGLLECAEPHDAEAKSALCTPMAAPATVVDALRNELASMRATGLKAHPVAGTFLMVGSLGRLAAIGPKATRQLLQDRADKGERDRVLANLERLCAEGASTPPFSAPGACGGGSRLVSAGGQSEASTVASGAHFDFDELDRLEQLTLQQA